MHCDAVSQTSSLVSNERQLVLQLLLTTLSGEEHQVIIDLQEFDRFDEFETAVLEQLPTIGDRSTPAEPLRDCNHFHPVVRQCRCRAEHNGQVKRNAKAIQVPLTRTGQVLPHAFTHMIYVRHVQVDAGIHSTPAQLTSMPERRRFPSMLCTPYSYCP